MKCPYRKISRFYYDRYSITSDQMIPTECTKDRSEYEKEEFLDCMKEACAAYIPGCGGDSVSGICGRIKG